MNSGFPSPDKSTLKYFATAYEASTTCAWRYLKYYKWFGKGASKSVEAWGAIVWISILWEIILNKLWSQKQTSRRCFHYNCLSILPSSFLVESHRFWWISPKSQQMNIKYRNSAALYWFRWIFIESCKKLSYITNLHYRTVQLLTFYRNPYYNLSV